MRYRLPRAVAIQQSFNLFQGNEATLEICEQYGLASVIRGPLGMGLLTGTLGRSRVYRSWRTSSVDVRAADGQPIWLSTDGEVATAESGFVHGKHPHELMVYRRQGPSHAGHDRT